MSPTSPLLFAQRQDERYVDGRAERSGETMWCVPGCTLMTATTQGATVDRDSYEPWSTSAPIVIDQLAFDVVTGAAGNTRIGFYRAGLDWQPYGAPIVDSGDIDTTATGIKTFTPSSPILLQPGRYLSIINSSATPTIRVYRGGPSNLNSSLGTNSFVQDMRFLRTYAAFPTPPNPWDVGNTAATPAHHKVVYRVSRP